MKISLNSVGLPSKKINSLSRIFFWLAADTRTKKNLVPPCDKKKKMSHSSATPSSSKHKYGASGGYRQRKQSSRKNEDVDTMMLTSSMPVSAMSHDLGMMFGSDAGLNGDGQKRSSATTSHHFNKRENKYASSAAQPSSSGDSRKDVANRLRSIQLSSAGASVYQRQQRNAASMQSTSFGGNNQTNISRATAPVRSRPSFLQHMSKYAVDASQYAFCNNCFSVNCECQCGNNANFVGAIDGHSTCCSFYRIAAVYGSIGPGNVDWTLTSNGVNSYILAPTGTMASMRAHFGFTDPSANPAPTNPTHIGELVFFANYTGSDEAANGMYMITSISTTQYVLQRVNWTGDRCYKIGVGDYILVRFGTDAFIYRFDFISKCKENDNRLEVSRSNYDSVKSAKRVFAVSQSCCNNNCGSCC